MDLADDLIKKGVLKNPRLIEAFRAVDRKDFVPKEFKDYAYVDAPLSIGEGQTISQPWTVAFMLELLCPDGCVGTNIMEIGYGSGWVTALLASVGANVYAVERMKRLCEWGKANFIKFTKSEARSTKSETTAKFFCQDGTLGLPEIAKQIGGFDKIIVAAAASAAPTLRRSYIDLIPLAWKNQLKIGGKIVAPVGNSIFEFTHTPNCLVCGFIKKHEIVPANMTHEFTEREHPGFTFVPLIADKA